MRGKRKSGPSWTGVVRHLESVTGAPMVALQDPTRWAETKD